MSTNMASDPSFPMIPGSASSGVPGPPMLRQPSYSGEDSTLASPGLSVELAALPGHNKTEVEQQELAQGTEGASGLTEHVDAASPMADVELAVPGVTPLTEGAAAVLSGAGATPGSEGKESICCGASSVVPPAGQVGEDGTAAFKGETEEEFTQRLPLGLNRYLLAVLFATVVLLKGCTYWGWNGFQDMFYKSGAYAWECRPGVPGYGQRMRVGGVDYEDCGPRKNSINNMYTVTFCTHFISSAFSGWVLDAAGPKICMLAAVLVEVAGWLFFAFSSKAFPAYYAGAVLLGIAADPAYLPLLSVSALFPGNESLIMSIMGSFRSISFAVPVILSKIYLLDSIPVDSMWVVIVCYVGVGLGFCFVVTLLLVPRKAFQPLSEEAKKRRKALRAAQKAAKIQRKSGAGTEQVAGMGGGGTAEVAASADGNRPAADRLLPPGEELALHQDKDGATAVAGKGFEEASACSSARPQAQEETYSTFLSCLKSCEFLLIVPCFCIALLRTEFYSKSNKEQLVVSTTGKDLYQMFSIVNILSFIPGPLMGWLADTFGIVFVLFLLNACGIFVYVFLMPNEIVCKCISIMFYFVYCSFVLSNLYCYVAVNFPQQFFGKLTGFASLIGGVLSLTSLGWYKLSSETLFSWYPNNYLLVDGVMVALGLINCFIIYGMYRRERKRKGLLVPGEKTSTDDAAAMC